MIKECVVLNGKVINIGPWDDQGGSNPLPECATVENRDFEYNVDRGWYEAGTPAPVTDKEKIALLEQKVDELTTKLNLQQD